MGKQTNFLCILKNVKTKFDMNGIKQLINQNIF